jgi:hypothetical protein
VAPAAPLGIKVGDGKEGGKGGKGGKGWERIVDEIEEVG